jgi:hypothetical protein
MREAYSLRTEFTTSNCMHSTIVAKHRNSTLNVIDSNLNYSRIYLMDTFDEYKCGNCGLIANIESKCDLCNDAFCAEHLKTHINDNICEICTNHYCDDQMQMLSTVGITANESSYDKCCIKCALNALDVKTNECMLTICNKCEEMIMEFPKNESLIKICERLKKIKKSNVMSCISNNQQNSLYIHRPSWIPN